MPLTGNQTRSFFENQAQMGIPNATVIQLQTEGINVVADLADFDTKTIEQIAANLRRPAGRVPDPNPAAAAGATIPTPSFVFGAKSQQRLTVAAKCVRFYDTVGRALTAGNLQWAPVMKNFFEQWKALEEKKGNDEPDVPKITKALPIIKWTEAFMDYCHRVIGVRTIPLAYIVRPTAEVPVIGVLQADSPHSAEHGSVEMELIARASHVHALFREDNSALYYKIEEATRGTAYAASIKPFQRMKNGRGAWLALVNQYAGNDKWEAEIKIHEQLLHTRVWKGQSNFPLEKFIGQHRNAHVSLQAASEHVTYQLPNEHSRVGYLLDGIQCSDAGLQAAIASINISTDVNGLRNDFEASATHLLPYDPVQKKRADHAGTKRGAAEISDVSGDDAAHVNANASAFGAKKGIGKTGVHLRYHSPADYKMLSKEQQGELREWRKNKKGKGSNDPSKTRANKFDREKAIASAVEKKFAAKMKSIAQEKTTEDEAEAFIMSIVQKYNGKKVQVSDATAKAEIAKSAPSLKSILKRAKNP